MTKTPAVAVNNSASNSETKAADRTVMSLDEYCARRSETDKRIPLLAGFNHQMEAAGMTRANVSAFDEAFNKYCNKKA